MRILLHICCGPCSIYPLKKLAQEGFSTMGFFYRHNIHPYTECVRRMETLSQYAAEKGVKMIWQEGYDLEGFIRRTAFREGDRCRMCYHDRLKTTALLARKGRFDCFSTTLLYSKFQNHELIRSIGEALSRETGVAFHYDDFRVGWKEGIIESKRLNMYRQGYCGCIYSEKERYYPKPKKCASKPENRPA